MIKSLCIFLGLMSLVLIAKPLKAQKDFIAFESGHVRPIAFDQANKRLYMVNTADNRLEIIDTDNNAIKPELSIFVGLEPVSVAVRNSEEVWVVNHLSDSVSVIDTSGLIPVIKTTLLVGDEPRDIVFAGENNEKAFITTAHRGQQRTSENIASVDGAGDPKLTQASIPRADVWVFDANNLGTTLGGKPLKIIELFGDTPRALAVSADKKTVYAAVFFSGNQTAVVHDGIVCDTPLDGNAQPCDGDGIQVEGGLADGKLPGGLPFPYYNNNNEPTPEVALIVQYDRRDKIWKDELGRNWNNAIRFNLPDKDVFAIDVDTLNEKAAYSHAGTVLYNMAVNPVNGKVYVTNTEANNAERFEGPGERAGHTVQGELHRTQITVIDPTDASVKARHINRHINYDQTPAPSGTKEHSLATPTDIKVSSDGNTVYVAAMGSSKVGVFASSDLEDDALWNNSGEEFDPTEASSRYIEISGGGVTGIELDEANKKLYVTTRFDNGLSVVDLEQAKEIEHITFFNPEPESVVAGRPMLYDAFKTSSNGEASCASCHVYGGMDQLAWDLGNPDEANTKNPTCFTTERGFGIGMDPFFVDYINGNGKPRDFAALKGPMTTQTLKGMQNHGHMHWRGDRATGFFGTDEAGIERVNGKIQNKTQCFDRDNPIDYDEKLSFKNFIVAFEGLMGDDKSVEDNQLQNDMDKFADFMLETMLPPNPIRNLDNSLNTIQQKGRDYYHGKVAGDTQLRHSDGAPASQGDFPDGEPGGNTCEGCHTLDERHGFFGTNGHTSFSGEIQILKVPHMRNMYDKVGMFGLPNRPGFGELDDNTHQGDQVRGFGFLHDGATDTLFHFMQGAVFVDPDPTVGFDEGEEGQNQRKAVEQYLLAFESDLAPIVGQQVTIMSGVSDSHLERLNLLIQRAEAEFISKELGGNVRECDLIANGIIDGLDRGFLYQVGTKRFKSDRMADASLSTEQLLDLAQAKNNQLTFTCAPYGSGQRMALDRDRDGVFDNDDDSNPPVESEIIVSISSDSVEEGNNLSFVIGLSEASNELITLELESEDISATNNQDYRFSTQQITFAIGETSQSINIETLDDSNDEETETFRLKVSRVVSGNVKDFSDTGLATITDNDDSTPVLPPVDATPSDGGGGAFSWWMVLFIAMFANARLALQVNNRGIGAK